MLYTNTPCISLSQVSKTQLKMREVEVEFADGHRAIYRARTIQVPDFGRNPTWHYVTITDPTQQGESVTTALTCNVSTSNEYVGVTGEIYLGAILALPDGSATMILPGGSPAPKLTLVGN